MATDPRNDKKRPRPTQRDRSSAPAPRKRTAAPRSSDSKRSGSSRTADTARPQRSSRRGVSQNPNTSKSGRSSATPPRGVTGSMPPARSKPLPSISQRQAPQRTRQKPVRDEARSTSRRSRPAIDVPRINVPGTINGRRPTKEQRADYLPGDAYTPRRSRVRADRNESQPPRSTRPTRSAQTKRRTPTANDIWMDDRAFEKRTRRNEYKEQARQAASGIGSGAGSVATVAFDGLRSGFAVIFDVVRSNAILRIVVALIAVLLVFTVVDTAANWGKIFPGVKYGTVDIGGKTPQEASQAINDEYASQVADAEVYVWASQEAMDSGKKGDSSLADQQSVAQEQAEKKVWIANADSLNSYFDSASAANDALKVGREDGGLLTRIGCFFGAITITPTATFGDASVTSLVTDISQTIGSVRADWGVAVTDGHASVVEGHDGVMVDEDWFKSKVNDAIFSSADERQFVAEATDAPVRIDQDKAQNTADIINASISKGVTFNFDGKSYPVDKATLGSWVQTSIEGSGSSYTLKPFIAADVAKPSIVSNLKPSNSSNTSIKFVKSNDTVMVRSSQDGSMPKAQDGVDEFNASHFVSTEPAETPYIELSGSDVPEVMSLDAAREYGLVSAFSSFTTEYTAGATARNHNIHLVSDFLNNSIVEPNGTWSFNEVAGDCNAERGFQGAGSIVDGEYVDEVGGGICQVATTVFNSVYDAGLPITQRSNHSLYIASYPEGRDAAVSYPDLDLKWQNDTGSDVLVSMSYTDTTVTATLYGIDPGRTVTTEVGQWSKGAEYDTKTVDDDTVPSGTTSVKTTGENGSEISIVRIVKDSSGKELYQDTFTSIYDPKSEVIINGTG